MPSRNCNTRPLSWRISCNEELAETVSLIGWEAAWVFINIIASVDNTGRMEGGKYQLRDMFFPHQEDMKPEKVEYILQHLHSGGLIIRYQIKRIWYIQLPKIGKYSGLKGNMRFVSDFPPPTTEDIKAWEEVFSDKYVPLEPRINGVNTPSSLKVKVKVKDKVKDIHIVKEVIEYLNQKTGKEYKTTSDNNQSLIIARFNEGYTADELKRIVDNMCELWLGDEKMERFLRPQTLFQHSKVEGYLNADKGMAKKIKDIKDGVGK